MPILKRFKIGEDFTEEEFIKWKSQLEWWISDTMPKIEYPALHAEKALLAAMNGTKLNGEVWPNISSNFFKRVKQLLGFDLELGIGIRRPGVGRQGAHSAHSNKTATNIDDIPPIDTAKAMEMQKKYISDLLEKYPHLENPVYAPKVEELAEVVVKGRMLSSEFLTAKTSQLEKLNKIRESLNKQVNDLMNFLEISPKLLVSKQQDTEKGTLGTLIAELESYGEVWESYERLDALRELIQRWKQLNSQRPDGTPQLNDWELWHLTRNRPVNFTCECGKNYTLLGGFTPEEIEQALLQAQKVYGFGLEPIGESIDSAPLFPEEVLTDTMMSEAPDSLEDDELDDENSNS